MTNVMKPADFARLCDVSTSMVSKYKRLGFLRTDAAGLVDVRASLAALQGTMDERRRKAALDRLALVGAPAAPSITVLPAADAARTPKAEREHWDAISAKLRAQKEASQLIEIAAVETVLADAIAAFRASADSARADQADRIAAAFGIPADKAPALARQLKGMINAALSAFVAELDKLGVVDTPAPSDETARTA